MMNRRAFLALHAAAAVLRAAPRVRTDLSIRADDFYINNHPTYAGRMWNGAKIEGLLMNVWAPRGDFSAALAEWRGSGVLSFTVNLQDGDSAFDPQGGLKKAVMSRLATVLDRADELGMAPIVGCFDAGQAIRLKDAAAVKRGVANAARWVLDRGYKNVMLEIANECDDPGYDLPILNPRHIHELIALAQEQKRDVQRLLIGTSFSGGSLPTANVIRESDFILLHDAGAGLMERTRKVRGYTPKPIVINQDSDASHREAALAAHVSYGSSKPDPEFFAKVKEVTGT